MREPMWCLASHLRWKLSGRFALLLNVAAVQGWQWLPAGFRLNKTRRWSSERRRSATLMFFKCGAKEARLMVALMALECLEWTKGASLASFYEHLLCALYLVYRLCAVCKIVPFSSLIFDWSAHSLTPPLPRLPANYVFACQKCCPQQACVSSPSDYEFLTFDLNYFYAWPAKL